MKKVLIVIVIGLLGSNTVKAQNPISVQLAMHIAQKMKDSLDLTMQQKQHIFSKNISLHQQKNQARNQINNFDSLRVRIQAIEKTRDSLYQTVLPAAKYTLYLQKKRHLISAN